MTTELGFTVDLNLPYDEALERVTAALKTEGFGVLTKIDVKATLKEKLGADFRPYAILGACNPPLAQRALTADASVGIMLPCNVVVEATGENAARVQLANPEVMMQAGALGENADLRAVAQEAKTRLTRVAEALRS